MSESGEKWGVLTADLGGTRLRVAVFDRDGAMLQKSVVPTPRDQPLALAGAMNAIRSRATIEIRKAVVGVPGPVSYRDGTVARLPNLPGWEGQLSAEQLTAEVGLPVSIANDADLAALGEHRYGAGRGTLDMVYVTSSTGVGAGVIIGGRLLHGRRSLAEIGHTIIEQATGGTVESLGSGSALGRVAGLDGATVAARARTGDERALSLFREVADAFATGVFNLTHCFMPERIVIGGGVSQAGELLLAPIRDRLRGCGPDCPAAGGDVVLASGGDDVGLLGAFALALDSV